MKCPLGQIIPTSFPKGSSGHIFTKSLEGEQREGTSFLKANILNFLFVLPESPEPCGVKIPMPPNSLSSLLFNPSEVFCGGTRGTQSLRRNSDTWRDGEAFSPLTERFGE